MLTDNTNKNPLALQKVMQFGAKFVAFRSKIALHFAQLLCENSAAIRKQIVMQNATQNAMQIKTKTRGFYNSISI